MAKTESKFVIKGGYIDGKLLDKSGVEVLSTMPSKDEARATFLATLLAVPQNFLRLLSAAPQNFVHLLAAREDALKSGRDK
jgi:large subunit ribosomal protein L10